MQGPKSRAGAYNGGLGELAGSRGLVSRGEDLSLDWVLVGMLAPVAEKGLNWEQWTREGGALMEED